jgi:uncharacterized phiE125 gp8 family phage protein
MSLQITVQPTTEPVTADEAKLHLRVDHTADDALIAGLITAAREYCEGYQGRAYITRTYAYTVAPYAGTRINLPMAPIQEVTGVTVRLEGEETETALTTDDYTLHLNGEFQGITPTNLPSSVETLTVTYTAGYGDAASDVPQSPKQAMLLLIGHWYENRMLTQGPTISQQELPISVKALLQMDRINWGAL